ncbi:MAG: GntR family transcriptional regulator [Lachnospiraceae bacterium]|nr:GntR family transcriptional regulator [Lachnospiraceae bacterium]
MPEMEYNASIPIYIQVMTSIKRDIVTGKIQPGEKLPSVRDLAIRYSINPNTVSRVYRELELEDVCFTRRGMGTFVTEDAGRVTRMREDMAQELIRDFLAGMRQLGIPDDEIKRLVEEYGKQEGG